VNNDVASTNATCCPVCSAWGRYQRRCGGLFYTWLEEEGYIHIYMQRLGCICTGVSKNVAPTNAPCYPVCSAWGRTTEAVG